MLIFGQRYSTHLTGNFAVQEKQNKTKNKQTNKQNLSMNLGICSPLWVE